jgi:hypothetical protein
MRIRWHWRALQTIASDLPNFALLEGFLPAGVLQEGFSALVKKAFVLVNELFEEIKEKWE